MQATHLERADMWANLALQAKGAKTHQIPQPVMFTHPDRLQDKPARKKASAAEAMAFFGQLKGR